MSKFLDEQKEAGPVIDYAFVTASQKRALDVVTDGYGGNWGNLMPACEYTSI